MSFPPMRERGFDGGIGDAWALAESSPPGIIAVVTLGRETVWQGAVRVNYSYFPMGDAWRLPIADVLMESLTPWHQLKRQ